MRADGRLLSSELRKQGYKVAGGEALDTHGWTSWRARTDDLLVALFPFKKGGSKISIITKIIVSILVVVLVVVVLVVVAGGDKGTQRRRFRG
jgi:hypothetical protein